MVSVGDASAQEVTSHALIQKEETAASVIGTAGGWRGMHNVRKCLQVARKLVLAGHVHWEHVDRHQLDLRLNTLALV